MIDKEKIPTTSLVDIMHEMSRVNELLEYIEIISTEKDMVNYEKYCYEKVSKDYRAYYDMLENELRNRGWLGKDKVLIKK